jgi:hypothetical protein
MPSVSLDLRSDVMTSSARWMMVSALFAFALGGTSQAGYVVNLTETGGDVVATGSGTINLTDLSFNIGSGGFPPVIIPNVGEALFGLPGSAIDLYDTPIGPASFGSGGTEATNIGTGDYVGIISISTNPFIDELAVPRNYVSGSALQSTATWTGQTFASLGVTPGTYTWTWGTGANGDFFTMNIGASSVPEPSSLLLGVCGLGAIARAASARRRQTRSTAPSA